MDAMTAPTDGAPIEVRTEGDGWWANTPWWFVSAGIHLVILLGATLVTIERLMAIQEPIVELRHLGDAAPPKLTEVQPVPGLTTTKADPLGADPDSPTTDEPVIIFDGAIDGNHNESKSNKDGNTMEGNDLDARGYIPGASSGPRGFLNSDRPGTHSSLGVGGGGGGTNRYGRPDWGGKDNIRKKGPPVGATVATEDAVLAALKWLARHQNPDGSWGTARHLDHCVGAKCAGTGDAEYDVGVTGLALLAYLGAGYTHLSKDEHPDSMNPGRRLRFGDVVKSGLRWLLSKQDPEGCIGPRGAKFMYNHTIAALALSEAYGMSATQAFKGPAQLAIDFILAAQNPGRAWRYTVKPGDNDSSVTGWAIMALKSAELSELTVPTREAFDGARKWFDEVTNTTTYHRTGYNGKDSGKVFVPGQNEQFDHHESMTAVAVMCRIFMSKDRNDPGLAGAHLLLADLPEWKANRIDFYYWYYASLALYQLDGPEGPKWKKWNEPMMKALVPNQKSAKDGCAHGSWTSQDDRWGFEGGRVYATAINALTLEVYYRYPNVFRGAK